MPDDVKIMCGHCGKRESEYSIKKLVTKLAIPVCKICLETKLPIILNAIA